MKGWGRGDASQRSRSAGGGRSGGEDDKGGSELQAEGTAQAKGWRENELSALGEPLGILGRRERGRWRGRQGRHHNGS